MSEESLITDTAPTEAAPETTAATEVDTATTETTTSEVTKSGSDTEAKAPKYAPYDPKNIPEKFIDKETGEIDIAALTKSYTEMEKKLGSNPAPDDYGFDEVLKESNLAWLSDDQPKEVTELFKKGKVSKEFAHELLKYHGKTMAAVTAKFGPPVNVAAEGEKLRSAWGDDFDSNMATVSKYAKSQPAHVATPLAKTADGMNVLLSLAKQSRGVQPLSDDAGSTLDLEAEAAKLIADPAYHQNTKQGDALRAKAAAIYERLDKRGR